MYLIYLLIDVGVPKSLPKDQLNITTNLKQTF